MSSAQMRVRGWFDRLEHATYGMTKEDACFLMVQARQIIEQSQTRSNFRIVSFYCDWIVHAELDRNVSACEVLRDLTIELVRNWSPTSDHFARSISRTIGLPQLRSELSELFASCDLPTVVFDHQENWRNFASFLTWNLQGQVAKFPEVPEGKCKRIWEEALAAERPHGVVIRSLVVGEHENVPHWVMGVGGEKEITLVAPIQVEVG